MSYALPRFLRLLVRRWMLEGGRRKCGCVVCCMLVCLQGEDLRNSPTFVLTHYFRTSRWTSAATRSWTRVRTSLWNEQNKRSRRSINSSSSSSSLLTNGICFAVEAYVPPSRYLQSPKKSTISERQAFIHPSSSAAIDRQPWVISSVRVSCVLCMLNDEVKVK